MAALLQLSETHEGSFDFFYLPLDFETRRHYGYAFINFTRPEHVVTFYRTYNGRKWKQGSKFAPRVSIWSLTAPFFVHLRRSLFLLLLLLLQRARLSFARIQGTMALRRRYASSSVMSMAPEFRPIFLPTAMMG